MSDMTDEARIEDEMDEAENAETVDESEKGEERSEHDIVNGQFAELFTYDEMVHYGDLLAVAAEKIKQGAELVRDGNLHDAVPTMVEGEIAMNNVRDTLIALCALRSFEKSIMGAAKS